MLAISGDFGFFGASLVFGGGTCEVMFLLNHNFNEWLAGTRYNFRMVAPVTDVLNSGQRGGAGMYVDYGRTEVRNGVWSGTRGIAWLERSEMEGRARVSTLGEAKRSVYTGKHPLWFG